MILNIIFLIIIFTCFLAGASVANNCGTYKNQLGYYHECKGFIKIAEEYDFFDKDQDKNIKDDLEWNDSNYNENDLNEKTKRYWVEQLKLAEKSLEKDRKSCYISRTIFYIFLAILLIIFFTYCV